MRIGKFTLPVAACLLMAGCGELAITDPNQRTSATFWQNQSDAIAGLNAVYNALTLAGGYAVDHAFVSDGRTDLVTSRSPDTGLLNLTRTVFSTYNHGRNVAAWRDPHQGIFRANLVLANVGSVPNLDPALKARIEAEAKFLRGTFFSLLMERYNSYPIITDVVSTEDRPANTRGAAAWAQIEKDFTEAAAVLPEKYTASTDIGRATKGAALSMLALAQLNQKKWAEGAATLKRVIDSNVYKLMPTFAENFVVSGDNNAEGIFEAQFGDVTQNPQGARGNGGPRLVGPSLIGFADAQPTEWYFQQFFAEAGRSYPNNPDPRLDFTIFWNKPGGMDVYGVQFATRYPNGFRETNVNKTYYLKKYQEYYRNTIDSNSPINFKVMRYATVLLLAAEAYTELNQVATAAGYLNQVRARVGMPPVPATLTQAQMRDRVEHEMLMELGWENQRLNYLQRQGKFRRAYLEPHDTDFFFHVDGKSEYLPIPQTETDLNPNITQNPGW